MNNIRLHIIIFISIMFPLWLGATSNKKEFTKEIEMSFRMVRSGDLSIINKHGKVDIKTWDKPEVRIDITIIVQAKDSDRAMSIFEKIKINFDNGTDFVKAITEINSTTNKWDSWSSHSSSPNKDDFEINYEVNMPINSSLQVKNNYGDTYISKTDGPVNAEIRYGSIRFEGINNQLQLYLGYGNATIIHAESINAEVNYSKLDIRQASDLDLNTKYSKIKIEEVKNMRNITTYDEFDIKKAESLRTEGKYGKFLINEVGKLITNGKYTDYIIGTLHKDADVVLSYGGLSIERLESSFESIYLDGSYANFKIETAPNIVYKVDANILYGDIKLPDLANMTYNRQSGNTSKIEGQVGNGVTESLIKVKVKYGDIRIR